MAADDSGGSTHGRLVNALLGSLYYRRRALIALAALAGLALVGAQAWRHARLRLRDDPRYRVTASNIETPPTPPWIRTDIRLEALRDAGLRGDLSVLDPADQLQKRLADAFAFHPWVEQVGAITKRPPNRIAIELTYRQPLAAITAEGPHGELVAVDRHGVRLPSRDLTDAELRYLPRVHGVTSTALDGEVWRDTRVLGAVSLVAAFGPERWQRIGLVDIVPRRLPEIRGDLRFPVFDLVTRGQTRIVWGAAPNASPPDEAPFDAKLATLEAYLRQYGPLHTNTSPHDVVDVRAELAFKQRTAKRESSKADAGGEKPVVK